MGELGPHGTCSTPLAFELLRLVLRTHSALHSKIGHHITPLRFTPLDSVRTLATIVSFYHSRFAKVRDVATGNLGVRNANISPEQDPVYEVISKRQEK
jgi:hypothetical protein